jgi:putative peptidoglycan lipid II flippase
MTGPRPRLSLAAVGRSAFVLSSAAAVSQVLAVVRELFLARNVGLSSSLDALIIGMTLPTTLALAYRGGATRAMVPAYVQAKLDHGLSGARRLSGVILFWIGGGGLVIGVVLFLLAAPIVHLAGPGLSEPDKATATGYLQLLAPVAFVVCVSGVVGSVLQAEEAFPGMAVAAIAEPAITLGIMLGGWSRLGLGALALGSLVGPTVGLAILLGVAVRRSVVPRLAVYARGLELKAFARHAVPISISLGLLQVNTVVDAAIGTLIGPGAVSALRYAGTLVRAPIGVISSAWGTAIYPALVQASHGADGSELGDASSRVLRYVLTFFVPIAALSAAVAPVAVSAAYGWGEFSADDLRLTAQALAALAPTILLVMYAPVLTSALNARRKGTILLIASVLDIASHVFLTITLGRLIGVVGVALASSLGMVVTTIYFSDRLSRLEPSFQQGPLLRMLLQTTIAAAPGALILGALAWAGWYLPGLVGGLASLVVYGLVGVAAYLVMSLRLGVVETRTLMAIVRGRLGRRPSFAR